MDVNLASASMLPERGELFKYRCVHPLWIRRFSAPKEKSVRATRGIADHLQHQGSSLQTRELIFPRFGGRVDYAASLMTCVFNSNSIGLT